MTILVRRSNLIVPASQHRMIRWAWNRNADAVTIDLQDGIPDAELQPARDTLQSAVAQVGKAGADAFVRVNAAYVYADIAAAMCRDLRGIVLPGPESERHVVDADAILTELERHNGVELGNTEIIPSIETAAGLWHIREIITASPRIRQVCIDEAELAASLCIVQGSDPDPFVYARGRLCIEATAAGVQPIAAVDPMGRGTENLSRQEMAKVAADARNLGFKGMVCSHPVWVNPVNDAYTPSESLVDYYTQVREVFAQALAAGTAAAPFAGRMIDVPVDEWAKDVLAMSAACAARDAEKHAALEKARIWQETAL